MNNTHTRTHQKGCGYRFRYVTVNAPECSFNAEAKVASLTQWVIRKFNVQSTLNNGYPFFLLPIKRMIKRANWAETHFVRYSARHHWHNVKQKRAILIKRAQIWYV